MNGVGVGTSTSSVTSSSGLARSMKAWRLERKTRKRWSSRMSIDAGWTQRSSKGSRPMRPWAMAARISRSERTTASEYGRRRGLAAAATRDRGERLLDRKGDLLGHASVPRILAPAHERSKLVVKSVEVLDARVHDLEPQIRQRVALRKPLEDHLADTLRRDLRYAASAKLRLDGVDQPVDVLRAEPARRCLADRTRELAPVELLAGAVTLQDLDAGGLAPFEGREALLATVADAPAADRVAVLRFARVDDPGVGVGTGRTVHETQDMGACPLNLGGGLENAQRANPNGPGARRPADARKACGGAIALRSAPGGARPPGPLPAPRAPRTG